jgi:addiction module HigA family antidote
MTIEREGLSRADFTDIGTGERIAAIHPGEVLRAEFLEPLGMSANALALALHLPAPRINDVVRGKRAVSPETALRLARYFGTSATFWLNLQNAHDLRIATETSGERIEREVQPLPQASRGPLPAVAHARSRAKTRGQTPPGE